MTAHLAETIEPRLVALVSAPWSRPVYLARVGSVVARYEKLLHLARAHDPREAGRLKMGLLHEHPMALKESDVVDEGELVVRRALAMKEQAALRASAPLPAPVAEPERTRVLALADVEWLMREMKLVRRHLRRRPPDAIAARYPEVGRADPIPELTSELIRAIGQIPRGRLFAVVARIAGARHGVTGLRELVVPEPKAASPDAAPSRVRACHVEEVIEGRGLAVDVHGRKIAIFRDAGELCALDDTCPHRGGPLHEGDVEKGAALCPLHAWAFDLRTGQMRGNPRLSVPVYEVTVEGDHVFVGPKKGPR